MFPLALMLTLTLLLFAVACGEQGGEDVAESPSEVDVAADPTPALLRATDLPPGWELTPEQQGSDLSPEEGGFCGKPVPDTASGSAVVHFNKGSAAQIVVTLVSHASVEDASVAFDILEQLVQTCKEWDVDAEGTSAGTGSALPLFPIWRTRQSGLASRATSKSSCRRGGARSMGQFLPT